MKYKLLNLVIFTVLLVMTFKLVYAVALTAAIGNGVTVIPRQNVEEGKQVVIDRELIVINKNNFTVNITLKPSAEIKSIIQLIDEEFQLEANKEKKAKFKIVLKDNYEHSGKILVYFKSPEGTVQIIASKLTILGDNSDDSTEDGDEENNLISDETDNNVSIKKNNAGNVTVKFGGTDNPRTSTSINFGWIILFVILIAIIGAIVGFVVLIKR